MAKVVESTQFAMPGFDPTDENLPPEERPRPRLSGCLMGGLLLVVIVGLIGLLVVQSVEQATAGEGLPTLLPTQPLVPDTQTPYPTYTQPPTWTPAPNQPTWTVAPSETPAPTATLTLTPIPPGMIASWTPGPWLLTKFREGVKKP